MYTFSIYVRISVYFLPTQDVPLFEGIISDLFPGVECPKPDYGVFMEALKDNIAKRQLQAVPWFLDKIIQLCLFQFTTSVSSAAHLEEKGQFSFKSGCTDSELL